MDNTHFYIALAAVVSGVLAGGLTALAMVPPRKTDPESLFVLGIPWASAIYWLCQLL